MIFTGIKCDVCNKQIEFPMMMSARDRKLPNGWYVVFTGEIDLTDPYHLCSSLCLNQWSLTRDDKQYVK